MKSAITTTIAVVAAAVTAGPLLADQGPVVPSEPGSSYRLTVAQVGDVLDQLGNGVRNEVRDRVRNEVQGRARNQDRNATAPGRRSANGDRRDRDQRRDSGVRNESGRRDRNERERADGRRDRDRGRNEYRDNRDNRGNRNRAGRGGASRRRGNSVLNRVLRNFPQAARAVYGSRRGRRNGGVYFRNNDRYYYSPQPTVSVSVPGVRSVSQSQEVNPVEVEFGGYVHIDELSRILPEAVNELCLDLHYNYSNNAEFKTTYRVAYDMLGGVKALRSSFESGDRDAVRSQLKEADQLFHNVADATGGWIREETKLIGESDLNTKVGIVGDLLHHAFYDVGISPEEHDQSTPQSTSLNEAPGQEVAPAPTN